MASGPDRDKDSNTSSPPKNENPFIRFRQFADEQISSLLRSVIGLPSTFERGQNAKWADFDDDLRRRDELQARQQQLRESEARRAFRRAEEEHMEHINKSWIGQTEKESLPPQMDEKIARDLPLFSPVYKSLFDHLDQRGDNAPNWNAAISVNSLKSVIPIYYPFALRREQQSPDFMTNMQYFVYNDLHGEPFMRSEYSLLPYILFSPYSPLKLAKDRAPFPPHDRGSKQDPFPYCEAFEDLIHETVHGKAAPPPRFGQHYSRYDSATLSINPSVGMHWIQKLHENGILQQREHRSVLDVVDWPSPSCTPRVENARRLFGDAGIPVDTEQDMYDIFLASQSPPPQTLGSMFSDAENYILKQLKNFESPEGRHILRELLDSKLAKDVLEMVKEAEKAAEMPASETEPRLKKYNPSSDAERIAEALSIETKSKDSKPTTPSQDSNKVVSTSTTSERHVDEDGSIETTVTIWKRFADGRESTTTTTHFEDAGAWKEPEENGREGKAEKKPEEQKKGWFWN